MPDFGNGHDRAAGMPMSNEARQGRQYPRREIQAPYRLETELGYWIPKTEFVEAGAADQTWRPIAGHRPSSSAAGVLGDTLSSYQGRPCVLNGITDNSTGDGDTNDQKDFLGPHNSREPFRNGG